jgi:Arc/MetJ-type ribon-helix-helix transcriptional regulator
MPDDEDEREETKLVQFKAPAERVEVWDEYWKDEPELTDRSDLIRKAIERTISSDTDNQQTQDAIGRAEALEKFERLESILDELDREVSRVQDDIVNEDKMDDIVLQRSYSATKRVLEQNGMLDDDS